MRKGKRERVKKWNLELPKLAAFHAQQLTTPTQSNQHVSKILDLSVEEVVVQAQDGGRINLVERFGGFGFWVSGCRVPGSGFRNEAERVALFGGVGFRF